MSDDPIEDELQFFEYKHLPAHLQAVSKPIGDLAHQLAAALPHNRQLLRALVRLVEVKDLAVRALVAK